MMRRFDYGFLAQEANAQAFADLRARIRKGLAGFKHFDRRHDAVMAVVKAQLLSDAANACCSFDGECVDESRLLDLAYRHDAPATGAEQDFLGCREALQEIFAKPDAMEIDSYTILRLHKRIAGGADPERAGDCKAKQCSLADVWPGVRIFASYKPCAPREALWGLQVWSHAYAEASANPAIDRLILIPSAMLDFIGMAPFARGSVRMSLLLGAALFCQSGVRPEVVCVLLSLLKETKTGLGAAVAEYCRAMRENRFNVWPFVETVLSTMEGVPFCLAAVVEAMRGKPGPALRRLQDNVQKPEDPYARVMRYAQRTRGCFTVADVLDGCPGLDKPAVSAALKRLQEEGFVVRRGAGRGTRYEASDERLARR